ncbi:hypothetical protein ACLM5H_03280 [Fredinandcohnia humi]
MKQALRTWIIAMFIITILAGCTSSSMTATDLYSTLHGNLTQEDQTRLESLLSHVQKFVQLNKELHMLLDKMKNNDELESAIETMEIAKQEALYIFNLIELDTNPEDKTLKKLKENIQGSIEKYMGGMNAQLEGITTGDAKKTEEGYKETQKIYKEMSDFLSKVK